VKAAASSLPFGSRNRFFTLEAYEYEALRAESIVVKMSPKRTST